MRTLLLLLTLILLGVSGTSSAQDFGRGLEALKSGDYAVALREWRPLAEAGNAASQFNLGILYERGFGVPQNYVAARDWYEKAANQGNLPAHVSIGRLYENGLGLAADPVRALIFYELAAARGWRQASEHRESLAAKMTPQQIAAADHLVTERQGGEPEEVAVESDAAALSVGAIENAAAAENATAAAPALPVPLPVVRKGQALLSTLGYKVGPADGVAGDCTVAAVRAFERKKTWSRRP